MTRLIICASYVPMRRGRHNLQDKLAPEKSQPNSFYLEDWRPANSNTGANRADSCKPPTSWSPVMSVGHARILPRLHGLKRWLMHFEILGDLASVETIATGSGIREIARLRKRYGRGRWRKRKGNAEVRLGSGEILRAEYTRMRRPALASGNSRLSASCEVDHHGSSGTAISNLHR